MSVLGVDPKGYNLRVGKGLGGSLKAEASKLQSGGQGRRVAYWGKYTCTECGHDDVWSTAAFLMKTEELVEELRQSLSGPQSLKHLLPDFTEKVCFSALEHMTTAVRHRPVLSIRPRAA